MTTHVFSLLTRGLQPDGSTIPLESVESLKIQVEDVEVALPASDDVLPRFGNSKTRPARFKALDFGKIVKGIVGGPVRGGTRTDKPCCKAPGRACACVAETGDYPGHR